MKSKGQTGESFKYIFGIIVGTMFLVFFIGFAYKYMTISGQTSDAQLANAINDDLTAISVSQNVQNSLTYGREINFQISQGLLTPISLTTGKPLQHIIYSPKEIQTDELLTTTKTLFLPFKVTNLFYIADRNTIYILIYDQGTQDFKDELTEGYSAIPSNIPYEVYDQQQIKNDLESLATITKNYKHVRFIFLTQKQINPENYFKDYSILEIKPSENTDFGTITYDDGTSIYLTKEMIIGSFLTENKQEYDYNLQQTLSKLQDITTIYYEKAKFISARLPNCEYTQIKTSLNNYKSFTNTDSHSSYENYIETIEQANKNLGGDCPEIF